MKIIALYRITILMTILVTALSSCGYHMSGTGGIVPEGLRTLSVPTFINGTNEPAVDIEVTRAVVNEFMTDGRLRIVDTEAADFVLRGTVSFFDVSPESYTADAFVQQYRVLLRIDARLEDRINGKIIWQEKNIESNLISSYPVAIDSIRDTKIAKEAAVRKASRDVAWTLRSRVLEGF